MRKQGWPCRPAENECDLTELCAGTSGECPTDLYVKNLVECNNGQGYCFNGECPSMRGQCKQVWGHKASPGDEACYQKFNMGGTQSGNCGNRPYGGGFKPCDIENILCGTLHCQEGASKPRIPGSTYSSHTQTVDGKEIQCKVMSGSYEQSELGIDGTRVDYGQVADGTKCGNQKMCMNRTCIDMQQYATYIRCPVDANNRECSDVGICSNINTCVCDMGFGGIDCSKKVATFPPPFDGKNDGKNGPPTTPEPDPSQTDSNTYIRKYMELFL